MSCTHKCILVNDKIGLKYFEHGRDSWHVLLLQAIIFEDSFVTLLYKYWSVDKIKKYKHKYFFKFLVVLFPNNRTRSCEYTVSKNISVLFKRWYFYYFRNYNYVLVQIPNYIHLCFG